MAFTPFIPDTEQWTEYFLKQVSNRKNNNGTCKQKNLEPCVYVGGGIAAKEDSNKLISVGKVKQKIQHKDKSNSNKIKVVLTSPAESTLDQAESELNYIKENNPKTNSTQRKAVKRKAPNHKNGSNSKGKKKVAKYNDVFSK